MICKLDNGSELPLDHIASHADGDHRGRGINGGDSPLGTADAGQEQAESSAFSGHPFALPRATMRRLKNITTFQRKTASPHAFKFAVGAAGEVSGYGSIFGNVDKNGERVVAGAFARSIARHNSEGSRPLMLWQHDDAEPIGRWDEFVEDGVGLWLSGRFNLQTTNGRDAYEHVKAGDVDGLSIGYRIVDARPVGDVIELIEVDLLETSVVSFPANRGARVRGVKFESAADVERLLRDGGVSRGAAVKIAAGGYPALSAKHLIPETAQLVERIGAATSELRSLKGLFR